MKKIYVSFTILIGLLFFQTVVFAQAIEEYTNLINTNQVTDHANFIVRDDKFDNADTSAIDSIYSVDDFVYAELDEDTTIDFMWPFTYKITLQIQDSTRNHALNTYTTCLTLHYDTLTGKPINYSTFYHFTGGRSFTVTVMNISYCDEYGGVGDWGTATPPPGFQVRGLIKIARDYSFSCSASKVTALTHTMDTTHLKLNLSWAPLIGATQYDVEWTFYDDSSTVTKNLVKHLDGGIMNYPYNSYFTNYCVRETTPNNYFTIPLNYPPGVIFTRVRPVKKMRSGQLVNGDWKGYTNFNNYIYDSIHTPGLEKNLNWQASNAFAENGMYKAGVNYFDGSLRNRQSVTVSNQEQLAIVGETYYDYNGRPVVKSLPVPSITDTTYKFHSDFNTDYYSPTPRPFGWYDFDTLGCNLQSWPMDSASGAAEYYSGSNPFTGASVNNNWFIPNAFGFPYTQTEYTPDNTGRISRQSGAGKDFILGSGHETKYSYGKPTQWELDRLFGNEAGDSSHYLKNLVVDPNGQISVSYIDAHGRVIATALAGDVPGNLQATADRTDSQIVTQSILSNQADSAAGTQTSTFSLLTENTGKYFFSYSLYPTADTVNASCSAASFCYDCLYDLSITVSGDCYTTYTKIDSNYTLPLYKDSTCAGPHNMTDTFTVTLTAGQSYTITKTLTISQPALQFNLNNFIAQDTCLLNYQDFVTEQMAAADFSGCNLTCATCMAEIGTRDSFIIKFVAILEKNGTLDTNGVKQPADTVGAHHEADSLYDMEVAACAALCNANSLDACATVYNALLGDVTPGGQYALYSIDPNNNYYATDVTSIFSTVSSTDQRLRYMVPTSTYLNPEGQPDSEYVSGSGIPGVKVPPEQLSIEDFISNWQSSWAASLVPWYHPEYCFYVFCTGNDSSNQYDANMMNITTYKEAQDSGYLNPLGVTSGVGDSFHINRVDPFFRTGESGSGDYTTVASHMLHYAPTTPYAPFWTQTYISMWGLAIGMVNCGGSNDPGCLGDTHDTAYHSIHAMCSGDSDAVWIAFRGLYYSYKTHIYDSIEFAQSSPCNYIIHPAIGLLTPGIPHAYNGTLSYILKYGSQSSAYWYKMPRFFNQTDYENSVNPNTVNALDSLVSSCDSFCIESAGNWIATLDSSCSLFSSLDTVDQDSARDYMIQVCEAACGDNHPYGASSQLPSNLTVYDGSHAFNSFEDVFNYFLFTKQSHAITYQDSGCSASEITFPPPYGITGTSEMGSTIIIQKDSCTCARITSYYQNYNTDVATLGSEFTTKCPSFLVYLDSIFNTQFTDTTVTILLNLCNNNSCDYLANPLVLPPQLSCGDCINCSQVEQQIDTFIHLYGCVSTVDTAKFNAMLTVYLNQVFGFNESYGQYMAFIKQCGEDTPKATVCSTPLPLPIGTLIIPAVKYPGNLWRIINNVAANPSVNPAQIIGIVSLPFSGSTGSLTLVTPGQAWTTLQTNTADTAVTIVVQFYSPLSNDSVNNYISKSPYTLSATTVKWIESNASVCTGLLNPLDSMQRDSTPPIFAGAPLVIDTTADTAGVEAPGLSSKGTVIFSSGADSTWCYNNPTLCGTPIFPVENAYQDTGNCRTELTGIAMANATQQYNFYIDSVEGSFTQNYIAHCMKAKESLTMQGSFNEYHYTLYYYDQAGNLEKTVPPNGVHPIAGSDTLAAAESYRNGTASAFQRPTQDYVTRYWYNTLNQMVKDSTPDGDTTHFWYDALGRLVVSQNSKQALEGEFSYTTYDAIGRIIEVGQTKAYTGSYPGPKHMSDRVSRNYDSLLRWLTWGYRGQVTHTFYDARAIKVPHLVQSNLRKRVASVAYYDTLSWSLTIESILDTDSYTYATHYSYDPQGNVQTIVQDIPALASVNNRYKRTDYDYDLQSGKVNFVYYERDSIDNFMQWYQYDADLRLTNVMTSLDQVQWDNDASYNYYNHGPLARMELGERQVQGVDYAYTINGWLKGINSSTGLVKNDMGQDGSIGNMVGADVFGEVIGYYNNDYRQIKATTQPFELAYAGSNFDAASAGLYNGNIRNATVSLRRKIYYGDTDVSMSPIGYAYNYDQLNRYVSMRAYNNFDTATNSWQSGGAALQDYAENVTYDGNGNILTYIRHGNPTIGTPTGLTAMDSMTYSYNTNNNQLNSVADGVSSSNYTTDIDNEVGDNYKYDKQGNMIFDSSQHLTITWNVRNKVNMVYNDSTKLLITFGYDAMGNRIMKKDSNLSSHKCYTQWYIRDAQGNPLAIYKERNDSLWWQESDIYGSSRVGVYYPDSLIYPKATQVNPNDTFRMALWEGKRQYELTNHLGNVLTTVSDKKIMLSSNAQNNSGTRNAYANIGTYQPEIVSVSDYYPFGMEEPGRNFSLSNDTAFHYGFNGKYKDNDIEGKSNAIDFEAREDDPRRGQVWTVDPDGRKYPALSPYLFANDNPISFIDVEGKYFDLSNLSREQRASWDSYIKRMSSSTLFKYVYDVLSSSSQPYVIKFGPTDNAGDASAYFLQNNNAVGGIIVFNNKIFTNDVPQSTVTTEEIFHAFQHDQKNVYSTPPSSSNIEFEAKLFVLLATAQASELFAYTSGTDDFNNNIIWGEYGGTLNSKTIQSPKFLQEYKSGLAQFSNYWKENDPANKGYSATPSPNGPELLTKVIKATETSTNKNTNTNTKTDNNTNKDSSGSFETTCPRF